MGQFSIIIRSQAEWPRSRISIPGKGKYFSRPHSIRTTYETYTPLNKWAPASPFPPEGKAGAELIWPLTFMWRRS
jgi:hypothetical protein